jgi:hypothetical protein
VLTQAGLELPLATFQNSLTNQNLFHTTTGGIPCFLLAKVEQVSLGGLGRRLVLHLLLSKGNGRNPLVFL